MYSLRVLSGLLIPEDYFQLLFKILWLLVSDFSEILENTMCLNKLRISALNKRVGVFFVNYLFFFFFLFKSRQRYLERVNGEI